MEHKIIDISAFSVLFNLQLGVLKPFYSLKIGQINFGTRFFTMPVNW